MNKYIEERQKCVFASFEQALLFVCVLFKSDLHSSKTARFLYQDTEFPGVVVRPIGEFRSTVDYQYQLLRCNVDLLKIIQLGLTFMNEDGAYPPGTTTWQFNFKFNLTWVACSHQTLSTSVFSLLIQTSLLVCCLILCSVQRGHVLTGLHRPSAELGPPV